MQNNEQPTKVFCLTEIFGEDFVKLHQASFLKNFSDFERKRIVRIFLARSSNGRFIQNPDRAAGTIALKMWCIPPAQPVVLISLQNVNMRLEHLENYSAFFASLLV